MTSHTLGRIPGVHIGAGRLAGLGEDITALAGAGVRVLLVADPALDGIGITGRAEAALRDARHVVTRFEELTSDPKEAQVAAGVRAARECQAEAVVALGGGSALDAGKMIAALVSPNSDIARYRLAATPLPARRVPLICVPTTAGTGAEVTATAVLSAEDGVKFWFWGDALKPDLALLDPELTVSLPAGLTAATGLDALVHAMEAATSRKAFAANDLFALEAIRLVVANLPKAIRRPDDIAAREALLRGAMLAGIAIDNAGTALAHNIGHALARLMPVHHGQAVALAMAATLDWVVEGNRAGFARVAEAFGLGPDPEALPAAFRALVEEVGCNLRMPRPLDADALAVAMAAPENAPMRAATARAVTDDDLATLAARVAAGKSVTA